MSRELCRKLVLLQREEVMTAKAHLCIFYIIATVQASN